jgi:hypothetical protein
MLLVPSDRAQRAEQPARACASFFGVPSHHATVEDNNAMLVVMEMLMSSDMPWASTTWTARAQDAWRR